MAKDKKSGAPAGESEVFTQGFRAAENGSDLTANPYTVGDKRWDEWKAGYQDFHDGQKEAAAVPKEKDADDEPDKELDF